MANLDDLNMFLKKDDLKEGDEIIFCNAGEIKDIDFSKGQDGSEVRRAFQVEVEERPGEKLYTPNSTTIHALSASWGKDTDSWVGKKGRVSFVKQLAFGKLTDVLILQPVVIVPSTAPTT